MKDKYGDDMNLTYFSVGMKDKYGDDMNLTYFSIGMKDKYGDDMNITYFSIGMKDKYGDANTSAKYSVELALMSVGFVLQSLLLLGQHLPGLSGWGSALPVL